MVTAILAAQELGADDAQVLFAANSGDVTGDHSRVVGYMAAALWADSSQKNTPKNTMSLTDEDKILLRQIARRAVEDSVNGKKVDTPEPIPASLKRKCCAFVTLRKKEKLRGCIGCLSANESLANTVHKMAISAALKDPRFPPVKIDELPDLEYEISVLGPLDKISNIKDIHVGTHGIYIKNGKRHGVLLPQVATEYQWDCITFLEQTCIKARLPKDAWKDPDTNIHIFSAVMF
jgi:AmmeMemoRadiSam system protein A